MKHILCTSKRFTNRISLKIIVASRNGWVNRRVSFFALDFTLPVFVDFSFCFNESLNKKTIYKFEWELNPSWLWIYWFAMNIKNNCFTKKWYSKFRLKKVFSIQLEHKPPTMCLNESQFPLSGPTGEFLLLSGAVEWKF